MYANFRFPYHELKTVKNTMPLSLYVKSASCFFLNNFPPMFPYPLKMSSHL